VTEAAAALLDWHFAGCERDAVVSSAHHDNIASLAVQKKLGFVPTGREMRFSQTLQHNVEHVVTTLSRRDWQLRGQA
jgi:RimJ/RimL family protein N-acetyltransferase